MFPVIVFTVFIAATLAEGDMRKCGKMMRPDMLQCCASAPQLDISLADDIKECFDMPMKPPTCDREICIAKKKGYYAADGSIDIKALSPLLEKEFKDAPEIFTMLKEKCLDGDISKFGPPDACDFMKMRHCIHVHLVMNCPEWSDKDECSDMKGLVEECAKVLQ